MTTKSEIQKMEAGDKVKTIYGDVEEVMLVNDCQVVTYESARKSSWYHPTKVFKI